MVWAFHLSKFFRRAQPFGARIQLSLAIGCLRQWFPSFRWRCFAIAKSRYLRMAHRQRPVAEVLEINKGFKSNGNGRPAKPFKGLSINIAGFGGQGVLLLGQLLAEMGTEQGLEASWLPSYGPEMRSDSAHCWVTLSKNQIGSPLTAKPDVLIAMNEVSLRKFAEQVPSGGFILYNGHALPADFPVPQAQVYCIPASEIADKLDRRRPPTSS